MAQEKEEVQTDEKASEQPKKSKKGLFIIIGIIVVALLGGVAVYALFLSGKGAKQEAGQENKKEQQKPALVALDSFVLNLADQGRFLKVTMQLELADPSGQQLISDRVPQLRDAIITLVSSKSVESVSSPEGKLQLKDELLLRANQSVGKDIVRNLYFTEFVMQ